MPADTLTVTATNTSAQRDTFLPVASAQELTTVFASDQNRTVDWLLSFDMETFSFRFTGVRYSEAYQTMLASERVLHQEWDQPEEDEAWADL